mmetsp:Transcript_9301/g.38150  ORF Transcript_9301/g.38150 Transcript_9301/m.38150 type:complete len:211 (+) Transcript_9301:1148-1780(+)
MRSRGSGEGGRDRSCHRHWVGSAPVTRAPSDASSGPPWCPRPPRPCHVLDPDRFRHHARGLVGGLQSKNVLPPAEKLPRTAEAQRRIIGNTKDQQTTWRCCSSSRTCRSRSGRASCSMAFRGCISSRGSASLWSAPTAVASRRCCAPSPNGLKTTTSSSAPAASRGASRRRHNKTRRPAALRRSCSSSRTRSSGRGSSRWPTWPRTTSET